jgi:hypothetical protein
MWPPAQTLRPPADMLPLAMTHIVPDHLLLPSHLHMPPLDSNSLDSLVLDTHIVRCRRRLPLGMPRQCTRKIPSWDEVVKPASSKLRATLGNRHSSRSIRKHKLSSHHTRPTATAAVVARVISG